MSKPTQPQTTASAPAITIEAIKRALSAFVPAARGTSELIFFLNQCKSLTLDEDHIQDLVLRIGNIFMSDAPNAEEYAAVVCVWLTSPANSNSLNLAIHNLIVAQQTFYTNPRSIGHILVQHLAGMRAANAPISGNASMGGNVPMNGNMGYQLVPQNHGGHMVGTGFGHAPDGMQMACYLNAKLDSIVSQNEELKDMLGQQAVKADANHTTTMNHLEKQASINFQHQETSNHFLAELLTQLKNNGKKTRTAGGNKKRPAKNESEESEGSDDSEEDDKPRRQNKRAKAAAAKKAAKKSDNKAGKISHVTEHDEEDDEKSETEMREDAALAAAALAAAAAAAAATPAAGAPTGTGAAAAATAAAAAAPGQMPPKERKNGKGVKVT